MTFDALEVVAAIIAVLLPLVMLVSSVWWLPMFDVARENLRGLLDE